MTQPGVFELDIITMVLLGGVSGFGGTGTLVGVGLSILLILNLRNGMSLVKYYRRHPNGRDRSTFDFIRAAAELAARDQSVVAAKSPYQTTINVAR